MDSLSGRVRGSALSILRSRVFGMKRTKRTTIRSWKQAHALLEGWRRELVSVEVTLKRPRVASVAPSTL